MPDPGDHNEPENIWRNQPMDHVAVSFKRIAGRRAREFDFATRVEIYVSICAALFFIAAISTRLPEMKGSTPLLVLSAVTFWACVIAWRFRGVLRPGTEEPEQLAVTGLEHYRKVLQRRRDHLKHFWTWQGPLLFAVAVTAGMLLQTALPSAKSLIAALPFFLLLVVWVVLAWVLRRRKIGELQREMDELDHGRD